MAERRSTINGIEVTTDGITVWVNTGVNLGRYGKLAVDVHAPEKVQLEEGQHCEDCFKRCSNPDKDWDRFKTGMKRVHGIDIPDDFKPRTFYEYAGFQYEVLPDGLGHIRMCPLPSQHPAAAKGKHRSNARQQFMQDRRGNEY